MATHAAASKAVFRIIDAMDAPHGGMILRLRLEKGSAPAVKELKGATMVATSPDGEEKRVQVEGFAVFGGKPSDKRLAKTGRADLRVTLLEGGTDERIALRWQLTAAS